MCCLGTLVLAAPLLVFQRGPTKPIGIFKRMAKLQKTQAVAAAFIEGSYLRHALKATRWRTDPTRSMSVPLDYSPLTDFLASAKGMEVKPYVYDVWAGSKPYNGVWPANTRGRLFGPSGSYATSSLVADLVFSAVAGIDTDHACPRLPNGKPSSASPHLIAVMSGSWYLPALVRAVQAGASVSVACTKRDWDGLLGHMKGETGLSVEEFQKVITPLHIDDVLSKLVMSSAGEEGAAESGSTIESNAAPASNPPLQPTLVAGPATVGSIEAPKKESVLQEPTPGSSGSSDSSSAGIPLPEALHRAAQYIAAQGIAPNTDITNSLNRLLSQAKVHDAVKAAIGTGPYFTVYEAVATAEAGKAWFTGKRVGRKWVVYWKGKGVSRESTTSTVPAAAAAAVVAETAPASEPAPVLAPPPAATPEVSPSTPASQPTLTASSALFAELCALALTKKAVESSKPTRAVLVSLLGLVGEKVATRVLLEEVKERVLAAQEQIRAKLEAMEEGKAP